MDTNTNYFPKESTTDRTRPRPDVEFFGKWYWWELLLIISVWMRNGSLLPSAEFECHFLKNIEVAEVDLLELEQLIDAEQTLPVPVEGDHGGAVGPRGELVDSVCLHQLADTEEETIATL